MIELLLGLDKLAIVLIFAVIVLGYLLYKAQTKPDSFDLRDLVLDNATGKVSVHSFGQAVALAVSTYTFVYLTLHNTLSESYFSLYIMTWAGASAISKGIDAYTNKSQDLDKAKKEE